MLHTSNNASFLWNGSSHTKIECSLLPLRYSDNSQTIFYFLATLKQMKIEVLSFFPLSITSNVQLRVRVHGTIEGDEE